jgi:hypothetical protein
MRMKTTVIVATALASAGFPFGAIGQEAIWPMPDAPAVVMNTLSTLQFYGPTPGFHHGLDLAAPAGTHVVAPVSGRVETGYYYERRSDYTYEVAIIAGDVTRWELHHMDPDDVPDAVESLARQGGEISAGETVGRIYDAAEIGIEPHLHINVIAPEGWYQNPLSRLPALGDELAPRIEHVWWARSEGDGSYAEVDPRETVPSVLVVDAWDLMPGMLGRQALYELRATRGGETIHAFTFDTLPERSFLEGLRDVYLLGELHTLDGQTARSEANETRRFLYAIPLDLERRPGMRIRIEVSDHAGNTAVKEIERAGPG